MAGSRMILIVDDDDDVRSAIADVLTDEGFRVARAAEGGEALDLLQIGPLPDLILLDWVMPGVDGAAFLAAIANVPAFRAIPIILFTAMSAAQRPAGYRVLPKPINLDELIWAVTEVCPPVWSNDGEPGTDRSSIPPFADDPPQTTATGDQTAREMCAGCGRRAAGRCASCGRAYCAACLPAQSTQSTQCARCEAASNR